MRILLIGGGSGGHITPLLAVAHELKKLHPQIELVGICEKNAAFAHLYQDDQSIDKVVQISAGKYRRYSGLTTKERLTDIKTPLLNVRDAGRTLRGYRQARQILKELRPDAMLIKGGFVAVPMGLAASRLGIPFVTHDSDSIPGLANRIVSRWASQHATGMPAELYDYPKNKIVYTGIPVSQKYEFVSDGARDNYRTALHLGSCKQVVTVIGGSQGGEQLNNDIISVATHLFSRFPELGILHIAGSTKEKQVREAYGKVLPSKFLDHIIVKGFVSDLHAYSGAADVVISRASATATAELALQGKPLILVPGRLAGGHQDKNAALFEQKQAAIVVPYGDQIALFNALTKLLNDPDLRKNLSNNVRLFAKPKAAEELARATIRLIEEQK